MDDAEPSSHETPVAPTKAQMRQWSLDHPEQAAERRAEREKVRAKAAAVRRLIPTVSGLFTDADLSRAAQVVRETMEAEMPVVVNLPGSAEGKTAVPGGQEVQFVPDNKARLEASKFLTAMVEGKPVERQLNIQADFKSLDDELKTLMLSSSVMQEALADLDASGFMLNDSIPREIN